MKRPHASRRANCTRLLILLREPPALRPLDATYCMNPCSSSHGGPAPVSLHPGSATFTIMGGTASGGGGRPVEGAGGALSRVSPSGAMQRRGGTRRHAATTSTRPGRETREPTSWAPAAAPRPSAARGARPAQKPHTLGGAPRAAPGRNSAHPTLTCSCIHTGPRPTVAHEPKAASLGGGASGPRKRHTEHSRAAP